MIGCGKEIKFIWLVIELLRSGDSRKFYKEFWIYRFKMADNEQRGTLYSLDARRKISQARNPVGMPYRPILVVDSWAPLRDRVGSSVAVKEDKKDDEE